MTGAATIGMIALDVAVILLAARVGGLLFERFGQPAVIGEIAAGIALGPTLLGALPGDPSAVVFAADAGDAVAVIGDIGLVLFMFTVGWQLDLRRVRQRERAAVLISLASIVLPFALGLALALHLHPAHGVVDTEPVPFAPFALFVGAALSVTAFPVLARILSDSGLARTSLGSLALSAAAVDDVVGWTILAGALAVLASAGAWDYLLIVGETAVFVAAVALLVKPGLHAAAPVRRPATDALVLLAALGGAYVTDRIGIHPVFGAFAVGVAMPRDGVTELWRGSGRAIGLLVAVYFVGAGTAVDIPGLRAGDLAALGLIVVAACAGKFLGAFGGARAARMKPRDAAAIAVLMNTRGVVEIVLLTVGRDRGLIDDRLFTLFALMAIFTTLLTTPLLRALALPALGRTGGRPVPAS
jgi:Kef-type K+ transport system membrane component KefB